MERLYSITDAAQALGGISTMTVQTWLSRGKLRRTKVGRRTMIRESELQRFLESGTDLKAVTKTLGVKL